MTNKFFPIFAIVFFCTTINAQSILTKIDSISITDAKIWGGISYDGTSINVTSMIHDNSSTQNHIHLIKFDTSLNQKGNPVQLTTNSDLVMGRGITDHKQLFINNNIYITYSLQQDQELLLFRIDTAGNRIGSLDTVEIGTNNPTNDMIFCTDNNLIHTLHFLPPHRHIINSFDLNLNKVGRDTTSHILAHNNIGEAVYKDSVFHMFTGNFFGHNSELILTEWKTNWDPLSNNAIQTLIPSVNGDGNWFSTAAEFDPVTELWFVGFQHVDQNTSINDEHIDIAVFDKNFNLLERHHATGDHTFRPHFLILDNHLYMIYDKSGNGVFIHKYRIQHTLTNQNIISGKTKKRVKAFPNPTGGLLNIEIKDYHGPVNVEIYDFTGKRLSSASSRTINIKNYSPGNYFLKIICDDHKEEIKIIKN